MSALTVARAVDAPGSPFATDIEVSGHRLLGDEPVAMGGADLGPSPFDVLTAALAECTSMTVRWYARNCGWPLEHITVIVSHEKTKIAGEIREVDRFSKTIEIHGDDLSAEQRDALIGIAARCPVQRTLEGKVQITTTVGN